MARKKDFIRWAIIGECGLYTGQCLTKRDAIAEHVSMINEGVSGWAIGRLDDDQMAAWKRCVKKGDRAVKVRISVQ